MHTTAGSDLAVAIMAAGKGKRMGNPDLAKVLAQLDGKPLLEYVIEQASQLHPQRIVVIVGHQADAVTAFVQTKFPDALTVLQSEQLGTGHAVQQAQKVLEHNVTDTLILSGDVPLLSAATLQAMYAHHLETQAVLTVLSTTVPDPFGYGRIIRGADDSLESIVEQKDATASEAAIDEINSGVYIVRTQHLFDALQRVQNANAQKEYYLTDIVAILRADGNRVSAFHIPSWQEVHGINTVADLERASVLRAQTLTQAC